MASEVANSDLSRRAWQRYWQSERISACMPDNPAAAAVIEAHWQREFAQLPSGVRVLDIATGNGVLLVWAARTAAAHGRALQLTGIDAAVIDPLRFVTAEQDALRDVVFHGGVAAEKLPFPDAVFDCVISQFGLEYSNLDHSLLELARVIAPGGRLRWLAHGGSSAVVAESAVKVAEMDFLLDREGAFSAMIFFATALLQGRRIARARDRLQDALERAQAYCLQHPPAGLVQQVCGSFMHMAVENQRYLPRDMVALVEENREKMRFYRRRLRDLLAAQLIPDRERQLRECFSSEVWQDFAMSPLIDNATGHHLGLIIAATRRPS